MPWFSKRANLLKDLEAIAKSHMIKAYLHFYLDAEDSFEEDLDHYVVVKLAVLKSSNYVCHSPYQTWNNNWEILQQQEDLLGDLAFSASSVLVPAFKKGHNSNLSKEQRYFNTKLAKVRIKSKDCLGLLKAWFQCLQGHQRVIQTKHDLDVILQVMMCVCILHNLLIDHAIPQDWMDNSMELEEDEELVHNGEGNQCDQIIAYLIEITKFC